MKKLPIGIQSIREILEEDQVYVDKTGFAKELIDSGKHYFISRPRRFGKSLFLNTLEEIFKGDKKLFKGCQIAESDYDWQTYPVLSFDFSRLAAGSGQELQISLQESIIKMGRSRGITLEGSSMQILLETLIEELAKKNRVVILVDEYDSPIINKLDHLEVAKNNRDLLKDFFTTLKSLDKYLKFTFVTGVSKFSQVSLFSGPNNLTDITMNPKYGDMMGYTEEELKANFVSHLEAQKGPLEELRHWYNGYKFSDRDISVYNPYSTLRFLSEKKAKSYWYGTGTPSFLIHELQNHPQSVVPLSGATATESQLMDISSLSHIDLTALMFQTGYLTIQSYSAASNRYQLGFPNQEVREAFLESLIHHFAKINPTLSTRCQELLEKKELASFFKQINALIASFPYQLFVKATEATYQCILLGLLKGMGLEAVAEGITNKGRTDLVIHLEQMIYLLELKLDSTSDAALSQIHQKGYFEQQTQKGKEIALVGVNFSSESRNIAAWKGELLSESGQKLNEL